MMQPNRVISIKGGESIAVFFTQQGWQNQKMVMANLQHAEMAAEQGDANKVKEILRLEQMSNNLFLRDQTRSGQGRSPQNPTDSKAQSKQSSAEAAQTKQ